MFDVRFGARFISSRLPLLDTLPLEPLLALVLRHGAVQQLVGPGVDPGELLEGLGPDEADLVRVWVGENDHLERQRQKHWKLQSRSTSLAKLFPLGPLFTSDV